MHKNFVQVRGNVYPELRQERQILGNFKFTDLNRLPFDARDEQIYIITCWNSTSYIKAGTESRYTVLETLGEPLALDTEYLVLSPKH